MTNNFSKNNVLLYSKQGLDSNMAQKTLLNAKGIHIILHRLANQLLEIENTPDAPNVNEKVQRVKQSMEDLRPLIEKELLA